jgi:hypothetical protein
MKLTLYGGLCILWFVLCTFVAGCFVSDYGSNGDIMIFKVDAGGMEQWHAIIDSGGDDNAKTIVQTPDGGYLVGGWIWRWGGPEAGDPESYGIFKFDRNGAAVWNATGPGDPVSSVAQTTKGIVVGLSGSRILFFDPGEGALEREILEDIDGVWQSVVGTADGGVAIAGLVGKDIQILKMDQNLTEEWRKTCWDDGRLKAFIQTLDGGYLMAVTTGAFGQINQTDSQMQILKLTVAGDLLWNTTPGGMRLQTVDFMSESPNGEYSVISRTIMEEGGQYVTKPVETVLDREGSVLEKKELGATYPIIKTSDSGYFSGSISCQRVSHLLIFHDLVCVPHIMKFEADKSEEWETALNATFELPSKIVSIIQTSDGGYALLMNVEKYPETPRRGEKGS